MLLSRRISWLLATSCLAVLSTVFSQAAASAAPVRAAACVPKLTPGDRTVPVTFNGTRYNVTIYLPPDIPAGSQPALVLNLHGSGSSGPNQLNYTNMRPTADKYKFVVAVPSGAIANGSGFNWNVPGVTTGPRNDVAFLGQVVDTLNSVVCTDPSRVYSAGYSGGGRMSSALACALATKIAAIAPVGGLRAGRPDPGNDTRPDPSSCRPTRPVPVIAFHGMQDNTNPYNGGGTAAWRYSVPVAQQRWATLDNCQSGPTTSPVTAHVNKISYGACRESAEVLLYSVTDSGHTWPGSPSESPGNGKTTREINANELMWRFFTQHPLQS